MPKVTFIQPDGTRVTAEATSGSLMEIATDHDVEGILGNCGGVCSCSTCHAFVPAEWLDKLPEPEAAELDALEFNDQRRPNSRLCCQIEFSEKLDGLVVEVAPEQ